VARIGEPFAEDPFERLVAEYIVMKLQPTSAAIDDTSAIHPSAPPCVGRASSRPSVSCSWR
jgi:hypothetical protein